MQPRTVYTYRQPAYPGRLDAERDPRLLRDHVPKEWRHRPELMSLLAFTLAVGSMETYLQPDSGQGHTAIVAPLFAHGRGLGALGCVVVAPPEFLSEEEGIQVIRDELAQVGLDSLSTDVEYSDIIVPQRMIPTRDYWQWWKGKVRNLPLHVDLLDYQRRIAIEFVWCEDFVRFLGTFDPSSVQYLDLREIALKLNERVRKGGRDVLFATLYDPVAMNWSRRDREVFTGYRVPKVDPPNVDFAEEFGARTLEESKLLLRRQVRDFIEWLRGQGVL